MKKIKSKLLSILTLFALILSTLPVNVYAAGDDIVVSEPERYYVSDFNNNREQNFNANWKFALGEQLNAQNPSFNDASWEQVNLPHDYSLEQEYTRNGEAESGYKLGGVGWYRKTFTISKTDDSKRYYINFDGVYMNSTVYINGEKLGEHPYGYTPFAYDLTDYLKDGDNIIAVRVDNNVPTSRWYSGSGISRTVTLITTADVHVGHEGIKIETPNLANEYKSEVTMNVKTSVENHSDKARTVVLVHTVLDKDGNVVGTTTSEKINIPQGKAVDNTTSLKVSNIKLWDTENPNLYRVETKVVENNEALDVVNTDYGFRYVYTKADTGFYLNGQNIKLKGVCMHHDQGSLGASQYYRAIERQVEMLKEMGVNLIRVTHNPASQELLDIANKHGMLLIDESFDGWILPKNGNSNDYSKYFERTIGENAMLHTSPDMTWAEYDVKAMVRRDMNTPAVIMYSLGNEVLEGTDWSRQAAYPAVMENLIKWTKEIDSTRQVTMGDNQLKGGYNNNILAMAKTVDREGGVVGLNYVGGNRYDQIHRDYPNWQLFGSETASSINSRGVYNRLTGGAQTIDKLLSSYDVSRVGWGAFAAEAWYDVITRDFVMGEAVWTGFDYLGEPTPWNGTGRGAVGSWPSPKSSYFGIIDTAGLPKDSYYLYQSQWNDNVHTLHILPAWNKEVVANSIGGVPVVVYTDLDKVDLYFTPVNGQRRLVGSQKFTTNKTKAGFTYKTADGRRGYEALYTEFKLPYEDGLLEAVGYDREGKIVTDTFGRNKVETAGAFAKLNLTADRDTILADNSDLAYITIDLVDAKGNIVPYANNDVEVIVEGAGELLAMDNGLHADHTPYNAGHRNAHAGKLIAIVKAKEEAGEIKVTAKSGNITQTISLSTSPANEEKDNEGVVYYTYSKNYLVKQASMVELPAAISAYTADGKEEEVKVNWKGLEKLDTNKPGSYEVKGITENYEDEVTVTVNVIEDVETLLNYSTTTLIGVVPELPNQRPAVTKTGKILDQAFDVKWQGISQEEVNKAGMFVKEGTATVFGKEIKVRATIRVSDAVVSIGANVAPQALRYSDDAVASKKSGNISKLIDNNIAGQIPINDNAWTNDKNFASYKTNANLVFEYATQQVFGEVDIYFTSLENHDFPNSGEISIYVSETGAANSYERVNAREEIIDLGDGLGQYKYNFNPIQATFVKIGLRNDSGPMAVTEVELKLATSSKATYDSVEFESLKVAGKNLTQADLAKDLYTTDEKAPMLEVKTKENASYTVVDKDEFTRIIILESENGQNIRTFTINIDASEKIDKASLQRAIKQAKENLIRSNYTAATKKTLEDALKVAESLEKDPNADQAKVNQATSNLIRAIFGLKRQKGVDKTDLNMTIETAKLDLESLDKSEYTAESIATYKKVLADAEAIAKNDDASKEDVDKATETLKNAPLLLEAKKSDLDTEKLEKLLINIERNPKLREKLASDVANAKEVLRNSTTQKQIDDTYKELLRKYFKS